MSAPAIAIHGGAGGRPGRRGDAVAAALAAALAAAQDVLESGGAALEAAVRAVVVLEDSPLFNAGQGAALCSDGTVELSAAVMRGEDRAAGAVAGVRTVRNPVLAAHALLDAPEVLMIAGAADALAARAGLAIVENAYFRTERRVDALAPHRQGTVGAVCRDGAGHLAAATSTGGITGQPPGRVGDSPVIGAGTWADARIAVSCTGDGEAFLRAGTARGLAAALAAGARLEDAARSALADVGALGGSGGLIALGADGDAVLPFTTAAMPRASWRSGGEACVEAG